MTYQKISSQQKAEETEEFLRELTELSAKHGIAITGEPILVTMVWEDRASNYSMDAASNLHFG